MADKLVYSTDPHYCAACGKSPCVCADQKIRPKQPEPVRLSFQRGAKGSGVTKVERMILHPTLKEQLLKKLKKRLGCGGTVQDGSLEFQGDHRDVVEAELRKEGFPVKRIGG
ncbi:MAG: stress response translation initiation inhibitor YciH [Elusimicrobia bacterium]|nr:stress response translation initiation inhibitor YciH [Elusimicrobiota bacterium]